MISFHVDDMTCGHCVGTVTRALANVDAAAKIEIDLATHRVRIEPASASAERLEDAIRDAGYEPVRLSGEH